MLVNATQDGGLIDNLFVGADIKVGPVRNCIGKFLNDEADAGVTVAVATTSKLVQIFMQTSLQITTLPIALTSGFACRTSRNVETCNAFFLFLP